jgi:uncharacterized protein (DUF2235 family)
MGEPVTGQARRRLIVTCDDPWQRQDQVHISNVEKLTRCIEVDPVATGDVPQVVLPQSGRGTTASTRKRFGRYGTRGLGANLAAAYRFLCYNYLPGDDIFVFGASRGALTARRLVGMVGRFGLLSREASVRGLLPEVMARYQGPTTARLLGGSDDEFRDQHCLSVSITFLGVFDTVGQLGIPGAFPSRRHSLHDVELSRQVQWACQALAIDEPRADYEPCLWRAYDDDPTAGRIKQVWFEGCHSDVTGGYAETGHSDTTLLWMATEAAKQGLVMDEALFDMYVGSGSHPIRHWPSGSARWRPRQRQDSFVGRSRRLQPSGAVGVRIAASALDHLSFEDGFYRPKNLIEHIQADGEAVIEPVVALPSLDWRRAQTLGDQLPER